MIKFYIDHTLRVGQINDYVNAQLNSLDTDGYDAASLSEYIITQLSDEDGYEEEKDDERLIRQAVARWLVQ